MTRCGNLCNMRPNLKSRWNKPAPQTTTRPAIVRAFFMPAIKSVKQGGPRPLHHGRNLQGRGPRPVGGSYRAADRAPQRAEISRRRRANGSGPRASGSGSDHRGGCHQHRKRRVIIHVQGPPHIGSKDAENAPKSAPHGTRPRGRVTVARAMFLANNYVIF